MGILFVVIVVLLVVVYASRQLIDIDSSDLNHPYFNKKPLTPTEVQFYERLVEALPKYVVLAQVQLSSFTGVDHYKTNEAYFEQG